MKLSNIFKNAPEIEIKGLSTDSRKVVKDSIFFCLDGYRTNGHKFIPQAINNGAICIVHSEDLSYYEDGIVYVKVSDVNETLNKVCAKFYNKASEKMTIFGVTGTNGKTTITNLIKDLYDHYAPCGYIGTVCITYKDVRLAPDLTTPDTIYLHSLLDDMQKAGCEAVALEVSSHGLDQHRVDAIDFDVAIFTNFTYDHLDFHGTMENYFNAKKKLFLNMKEDSVSILNVDDPVFSRVKEACPNRVVTYGYENEADYKIKNVSLTTSSSAFTLVYKDIEYNVTSHLSAMYNVYNLVAAIAALVETGKDIHEVIAYVKDLHAVEGRLESIDEGQPFTVIVDFAHTPDGLRKVYEYAKTITPEGNDIIAVFGSAGKRDKAKRKVFGEISDEFCDYIVLTEDDPRDEDAHDIALQIKSGIKNTNNIFIEDRYDAIRNAIESANVNDTVLLLGKGDEVFIYREEGRVPWMGDHMAAREIIKKYWLGNEE